MKPGLDNDWTGQENKYETVSFWKKRKKAGGRRCPILKQEHPRKH
jgi:hypothetical protein